jgi:hypothetical protein
MPTGIRVWQSTDLLIPPRQISNLPDGALAELP